ncbi:hypothetical protein PAPPERLAPAPP_01390 [Brevundimonas phage vB_BpoS-Papperlapapp]|nr:hypothetical protein PAPPERLAPAPP_01390 [Brevundimonas phage vB_BpoS-Papperlapapp]UTC29100.1 hypothetical protein BAMBUS_00170 [Brevundimonas phage vB_BpoS-Bambus]
MAFLPPSAKLSKPTHKIVGPDGTEYFLIQHTTNTLRIKILYDAPNWVDVTPAGSVSTGRGTAAADGVMMGNWIGPLIHHFTGAALDKLPDGTRCVEVDPAPSFSDYRSDVIWSGWGSGYQPDIAFVRAGLREAPTLRAELDAARPLLVAHRQRLVAGEILSPREKPEVYAEFLSDADRALAYLDFMDTVPDLATRPRKVAA